MTLYIGQKTRQVDLCHTLTHLCFYQSTKQFVRIILHLSRDKH